MPFIYAVFCHNLRCGITGNTLKECVGGLEGWKLTEFAPNIVRNLFTSRAAVRFSTRFCYIKLVISLANNNFAYNS
jgi:hypothetical protein